MRDAALTSWVIEVSDDEFETEVIERSQQTAVVIDFWAEWCEPCRQLGPKLEALAKKKAGAFVLAKVNVEAAQQLAGAFQIEGIPAIRVISKGQLVNGFDGLLPEAELAEFIDQICPSQADDYLQTLLALETTDPKKAEAEYQRLMTEDPKDERPRLALARVLVQQHQDAAALALLAPLGVTGEIGSEAERLRRILDLRKDGGTLGDESALRKQIAAEPENAKARYELGAMLAKLERYPEALEVLLSAAELDPLLARNEVRELMVKIWEIIGTRSELADATRDRLRTLLY